MEYFIFLVLWLAALAIVFLMYFVMHDMHSRFKGLASVVNYELKYFRQRIQERDEEQIKNRNWTYRDHILTDIAYEHNDSGYCWHAHSECPDSKDIAHGCGKTLMEALEQLTISIDELIEMQNA